MMHQNENTRKHTHIYKWMVACVIVHKSFHLCLSRTLNALKDFTIKSST